MTETPPDYGPERVIYTPSRLTGEVRMLLENTFPSVWVEGEISNFARPQSGHWYFSLKDSEAQIRCAMFRSANRRVGSEPGNGQQVLVRGRLSLYIARGEFQLIADEMEDAGEGALRRAFEALRRKLQDEGLFDDATKQPIPPVPRRIAVITSATGAAIQDVTSTLSRRFPLAPLQLFAVPVQGAAAAPAITAALQRVGALGNADVILLVRGGGSLEDLWAFNEESVARAIAACPIPIISGVGHESDITIADLAADRRAATPTAAAELAAPDIREWSQSVTQFHARLLRHFSNQVVRHRAQLDTLRKRLEAGHPRRRLESGAQQLDELRARLLRLAHQAVTTDRVRLETQHSRLLRASPAQRITEQRRKLDFLAHRRDTALRRTIAERRSALSVAAAKIEQLSPLSTLARGYAVATRASDGRVLKTAEQVKPGDPVDIRLHQGQLDCRVARIKP